MKIYTTHTFYQKTDEGTAMQYGFEMKNGNWTYRHENDFRDEEHARQWAKLCGFEFRGAYNFSIRDSAPGSASWCETYSDNH